ncbi:LAMI_0B00936g1_1 [Lachancea mirantina]|uniref:LAMI_0B00936g1_1 n=1 Tax=Lachancea mirantina TaxID=1230905 RepID=A0A1G4ITG0_9SACH|nr:LAMI_0B00936g1_1 [Lachancea mirantina]
MSTKEVGMLDVGTHCAFCRQLDFLPFNCSQCGKQFCSSHRTKEAHHCVSAIAPSTKNGPSVNLIPSKPSGDGESYFTSLLPEKGHIRVNQNPAPANAQPSVREQLQQAGKARALAKLKQFFTRQSSSAAATGQKGSTNKKSPANKLLLIAQLKKTAQGDNKIPLENRVYVYCFVVEAKDELRRRQLFINKIWPVGRALDYVAAQLDVLNHNTDVNSASEDKLYLYRETSRGPSLLDPGARVATSIKNGDTIYLIRGSKVPS